MKWSVVVVAGLVLGCAHSRREKVAAAPAPPPPPPGSTVQADDTREAPVTLEQMLAGKISGVVVTRAPGGGISVRMGGPTSFYSGQEPLFVVDGVPFEGGRNGTLTWLNPRDVESIEALKDPTQTAMYGVRGANGVIVIKTKGSH